jgi:hypothetical protein
VAYISRVRTTGGRRQHTSRMKPPKVPENIAEMHAINGCKPAVMANCAPIVAKAARPMVSPHSIIELLADSHHNPR